MISGKLGWGSGPRKGQNVCQADPRTKARAVCSFQCDDDEIDLAVREAAHAFETCAWRLPRRALHFSSPLPMKSKTGRGTDRVGRRRNRLAARLEGERSRTTCNRLFANVLREGSSSKRSSIRRSGLNARRA